MLQANKIKKKSILPWTNKYSCFLKIWCNVVEDLIKNLTYLLGGSWAYDLNSPFLQFGFLGEAAWALGFSHPFLREICGGAGRWGLQYRQKCSKWFCHLCEMFIGAQNHNRFFAGNIRVHYWISCLYFHNLIWCLLWMCLACSSIGQNTHHYRTQKYIHAQAQETLLRSIPLSMHVMNVSPKVYSGKFWSFQVRI